MNYLIPLSIRELLLVVFWLTLALAGAGIGYAIVAQSYGMNYQVPAITALISILCAVVIAFAFEPDHWAPPLDPWQTQRELMRASDQPQPAYASITKYSLMYYALILEEAGELGRELTQAIDRRYTTGDEDSGRAWITRPRGMREATDVMRLISYEHLANASIQLRNACARMPENFSILLSRNEAKGIADGTTDIAVVNCGFALASGIPGAESYAEVGESNLSKRNPATGKIDKDPTGKWIKGEDYREPDLGRVLDLHGATLDYGRSQVRLL